MSTIENLEVDRSFKYQFYHRENSEWLKSLDFFKEEIKYLKGLITNVNKKNTSHEVQNETFIFNRELDSLACDIDAVNQSIVEEEWGFDDDAMGKDFLLGEEIYNRHIVIRENFQKAEKAFYDIKHRLYRFLCKSL